MPVRFARRTTPAAGLLLVAIASLVLVGWTFDVDNLITLFGPITMKANAAVGILAAGVALILVSSSTRWGGLIGSSVGSSRVDLQACKLEYSIVSPK